MTVLETPRSSIIGPFLEQRLERAPDRLLDDLRASRLGWMPSELFTRGIRRRQPGKTVRRPPRDRAPGRGTPAGTRLV
jgi:hypothetical protein